MWYIPAFGDERQQTNRGSLCESRITNPLDVGRAGDAFEEQYKQ